MIEYMAFFLTSQLYCRGILGYCVFIVCVYSRLTVPHGMNWLLCFHRLHVQQVNCAAWDELAIVFSSFVCTTG